MKTHSKVLALVLAFVLVLPITPVLANEIMPLTDDEFYSFTYYPDCGGEVDIEYKISVTSSGRFIVSVVSTSTAWEVLNSAIWRRFVPLTCTVSSQTSSGCTIKLYGYLEYFSPVDGSGSIDGYYTYYINRSHNLS